jgi:hypothetical protein
MQVLTNFGRRAAITMVCTGALLAAGGWAWPTRAGAQQSCAFPDVCFVPLVPARAVQQLLERTWTADELATFLEESAEVQYTGPQERPARLASHYEVWSQGESRPLATRGGRSVDLQPGTHGLAEASGGIFSALPGDLARMVTGPRTRPDTRRQIQFVVTAAQTLEGGPQTVVRQAQVFARGATHAIAFYFARDGSSTSGRQVGPAKEFVLVVSVTTK